jgi:N-acetylmuramoyl-L-alanine amidase
LRFFGLIFALWSTCLGAAELKEIKIFVGDGHAQLLLVGDSAFNRPETRSNPALGSAPARAMVSLRAAALDPLLQEAYQEVKGRWLIPVGRKGVRQVTLSQVGTDLHIGFESDQLRTTTVTAIGERALLVDLRLKDAPKDASLPSPELLASWVAGASLKRQAAVGSGEKRRLIVVDPGHGGRDSGAVGVSGIHEADVALAIAHRLKRSLERTLDAEVILTRDDDRFVPLQERAAIANALDADLFVSVHANASPSSQAWGIETFYLDAASDAGAARVALRENALSQGEKRDDLLTDLFVTGTNRLSRLLAQQVQGRVIHHVTERFGAEQSHDLGVKTALFAVLVWTRMPSILFESSFLSNPEDEIRLRMPTYQQTLADAMAEGIGLWFEQRGR